MPSNSPLSPFTHQPFLPINALNVPLHDPNNPFDSFDPLAPTPISLNFKANEPVGIHFRWTHNSSYTVVGFTDNSPAFAQGKVCPGATLISVNHVDLQGLKQASVNEAMKSAAGQPRILRFKMPQAVKPPRPRGAAQQSKQQHHHHQQQQKVNLPPQQQLQRRKSSDSDITTPARRMRIVYEFTKTYVLKTLLPLGLEAGVIMYYRIEAARVVQRGVRAWLAARIVRVLRKIRRHNASVKIQGQVRRMLAVLQLWRLRRERDRGIRGASATVLQCFGRAIAARRLLALLKERHRQRFIRSCLLIQTAVRRMKQLKKFNDARKKAVKIQSSVRSRQGRSAYRISRIAAIRVQARCRVVLAKSARLNRIKAGDVIRRFARMIYERREARYKCEEIRKQREEEQEEEQAALEPISPAPPQPVATPQTTGEHTELEDSMFSDGVSESSAESPAKWQLRFSPDKDSLARNDEKHGIEISDEAENPMSKLQREGMVVMTMESPEEKMSRIDQEEIFRQDREAKEKIIRDGIAVKLQARFRGYGSRKRVDAMKRAVKGLADKILDIKHKQRCRRAVLLLIKRRNEAATALQRIVRGLLSKKKVDSKRRLRMEYVVEEVEKAFRITELVGMNESSPSSFSGKHFFNGEGEVRNGLSEGDLFSPSYSKEEMKWLRIFPDHAKPSYGCDLFQRVEDRADTQPMHVSLVGEGLIYGNK
ncbi:hypothetical protein TrVE_jg11264 [Triparma verrucosa]|uniref:PDZ domain-containing protein n=1 Tax=Triparma verrucosa TaxID=1606542 RepID=A0A9W7KW51_9STRA|nr:hypothetical protein TrVE_jg11264 [Triparma verrucosa]